MKDYTDVTGSIQVNSIAELLRLVGPQQFLQKSVGILPYMADLFALIEYRFIDAIDSTTSSLPFKNISGQILGHLNLLIEENMVLTKLDQFAYRDANQPASFTDIASFLDVGTQDTPTFLGKIDSLC